MNEQLQSIKLDTLPPNCTSKLQPSDLGIIKNFNRQKLINKLLIALKQNDRDGYCVNILDAMRWVRSSSWDAVTEGTIKLFRKGWFCDTTVELQDEC